MIGRIKFFISRLRERLWVRPLAMCFLSIAAVFLGKAGDYGDVARFVPDISPETIETLLQIISASMLVIATFAVGSMVSSYASASGTATPRSFALVISDDVSQNALSSFIGAFIFSIVALIAVLNDFYEVGIRLQKSFHALAIAGDPDMREAAKHQSAVALERAELALKLPRDLEAIRKLGRLVGES